MIPARNPTVEQRLTQLEKDMNAVARIVKSLRKQTEDSPPPPPKLRVPTGLTGKGC
jgi:hypothetical protein